MSDKKQVSTWGFSEHLTVLPAAPAATGSGEPKLPEGADDPELFRKQRDWLLTECNRIGITVNVAIGEDIRKAYRLSLPTPPASQPTVTLDRETPAIYAASRASVPERPAMWKRLRSEGHNIISSWIDEAGPGETADLSELWTRIVREVTTADRLVLYVEPDDFPLKGALLEVGFALASGRRVYVVAPGCDFTAPSYRPIGSWIKHPLVTVCDMRLALLRAAEQK